MFQGRGRFSVLAGPNPSICFQLPKKVNILRSEGELSGERLRDQILIGSFFPSWENLPLYFVGPNCWVKF